MKDGPSISMRICDPPPAPDDDLVRRIDAILRPHAEIAAAALLLHHVTLDGVDRGERLSLSLLPVDPPTEPSAETRALLSEISHPVRLQTGIESVSITAAAAVKVFHTRGRLIYTR